MPIQKTVFVFIFGIAFTACMKGKSLPLITLNSHLLNHSKTDLSESVFFIGPEIDSERREISAECDCCASDLAFLDDSSFMYVERCLGGDGYIKGNYLVFGDHVFMHVNGKAVSEEEDLLTNQTTYTVINQKDSWFAYKLTDAHNKPLLHYQKNDYNEFGLPSKQITLDGFLEEFHHNKVLKEFLEN